jgi:Rps23 Pro-64 3,4-dihydroxylase Tpa1-like proline 4-hydroxylase
MTEALLSRPVVSSTPFPHFSISPVLSDDRAAVALEWLKQRAPWILRIEDFYEQEEFSLFEPRAAISFLVENSFLEQMRELIRREFDLRIAPVVVDVNAHRLTRGQTIRIHNDFIDGKETHRLLIQLNTGWMADQGGLLMLFSGPAPENVSRIILPKHRSALAFEISPRSFHAVSEVKHGERYTIVYSFRATP